jgi:hypothetical protein
LKPPTDFLVPSFEVLIVGDSSKSIVNSEVLSIVDLINFYINNLAPLSSPEPPFIFNKVFAFSGRVAHK